MTDRNVISSWFSEGKRNGATHMLVVCDTFDHEDYPVYCASNKEAREKYNYYDGNNMQRVIEVYDLRQPKAEQISETRTFRLPKD